MDKPSSHIDITHAASALQADPLYEGSWAGLQEDRDDRHALTRVEGLESGIAREEGVDIEYRQLRLERVILVGLWGIEKENISFSSQPASFSSSVESSHPRASLHTPMRNKHAHDRNDAPRTTASTPGRMRHIVTREEAEESLRELAALATTAGSHVLDGILQHRDKPDSATFLGAGKARELAELVKTLQADTVITDSELAPSQRRALEDIVDVKVIDRTALILDIFASHASSKEGKAQVELAQLEYLLPRLRGWGDSMSRQAGGRVAGGAGIGSRGPGETKIELDRRRIRQRMALLRAQIKKMKPQREGRARERQQSPVAHVAIVGYTNAGKSSLLNYLTDANVLVENALFATLDPTIRRCELPSGRIVTLSDTVGFVRNLPTQLVEAFRSTLEEVAMADVIVHVVDASHEAPLEQVAAVHQVLSEIEGVRERPEIIALSKADLIDSLQGASLRSLLPGSVLISCASGQGIEQLRERIEEALPGQEIECRALIPYTHGEVIARIFDEGRVLSELEHTGHGTWVHARVSEEIFHSLSAIAPEVDVIFAGKGQTRGR